MIVCRAAVLAAEPNVLAAADNPLHRVSIVRAPVARRRVYDGPAGRLRVEGQDRHGRHAAADTGRHRQPTDHRRRSAAFPLLA